jgi:hypothetical protein
MGWWRDASIVIGVILGGAAIYALLTAPVMHRIDEEAKSRAEGDSIITARISVLRQDNIEIIHALGIKARRK